MKNERKNFRYAHTENRCLTNGEMRTCRIGIKVTEALWGRVLGAVSLDFW